MFESLIQVNTQQLIGYKLGHFKIVTGTERGIGIEILRIECEVKTLAATQEIFFIQISCASALILIELQVVIKKMGKFLHLFAQKIFFSFLAAIWPSCFNVKKLSGSK